MPSPIVQLAILGAIIWFWYSNTRAREYAGSIAKRVCRDMQLQQLDDSVALRSLSVAWRGRPVLRRRFSFDFSTNGADRRRGNVLIIDGLLEGVHLEHPDGAIWIDPTRQHRRLD